MHYLSRLVIRSQACEETQDILQSWFRYEIFQLVTICAEQRGLDTRRMYLQENPERKG